MQIILDAMTRSEIRQSLGKLSSDLGQAFEHTMHRIYQQPRNRQQVAVKALMWISHARRPLLIEELCHALATQVGDSEIDEEAVLHPKNIIESCFGLVVLDEKSMTVQLVHYALQEFLRSQERSSPVNYEEEETHITLILLTYLCIQNLEVCFCATVIGEDDASQDGWHMRPRPMCTSFLEYASSNWGHHASISSLDTIRAPALSFLNDTFSVERANRVLINTSRYKGDVPCIRCMMISPNRTSRTALHILAGFGLSDLMLLLLDNGADVNACDDRGNTPLHAVAVSGTTKATRVLLQRFAEVDSKNFDDNTPLFVAVSFSRDEVLLDLLSHGANLNSQCGDSWSPLHKAADNGDIHIAKILLAHGASVSSESGRGLIPLHRAAGRGHSAMIHLLLAAGSSIDFQTDDGWTPLHGASNSGQHTAVQMLIDHKAVVDRQSTDGRTALHRACRGGHCSSALALLNAQAAIMQADRSGEIPLHRAAKGGHFRVINLLLMQEQSLVLRQLTSLNSHQRTPREEASNSGHWNLAADLRRRQSECEGSTIILHSDLEIAIETGDVALIKTLLAQGINTNLLNQDGFAPVHLAMLTGNIATAGVFLTHVPADIDMKTADGWTPLHCAAITGKEDLVNLCLEKGGDISACTTDGQTALHKACKSGCVETVKLLLEKGANPEAEDKWAWRPLHSAAAGGSKAIVEVLDKNEVDVWARDKKHCSAMTCAAAAGHYDVAEYLRQRRIEVEGTLIYPDQLQTVLRTRPTKPDLFTT